LPARRRQLAARVALALRRLDLLGLRLRELREQQRSGRAVSWSMRSSVTTMPLSCWNFDSRACERLEVRAQRSWSGRPARSADWRAGSTPQLDRTFHVGLRERVGGGGGEGRVGFTKVMLMTLLPREGSTERPLCSRFGEVAVERESWRRWIHAIAAPQRASAPRRAS
jgi:hypothetical protein